MKLFFDDRLLAMRNVFFHRMADGVSVLDRESCGSGNRLWAQRFDSRSIDTRCTIESRCDFSSAGEEINLAWIDRRSFSKPGKYNLDVQVGFYTSVLGLGESPDAVDDRWCGAHDRAVDERERHLQLLAMC